MMMTATTTTTMMFITTNIIISQVREERGIVFRDLGDRVAQLLHLSVPPGPGPLPRLAPGTAGQGAGAGQGTGGEGEGGTEMYVVRVRSSLCPLFSLFSSSLSGTEI
jgi:hypothetical protein